MLNFKKENKKYYNGCSYETILAVCDEVKPSIVEVFLTDKEIRKGYLEITTWVQNLPEDWSLWEIKDLIDNLYKLSPQAKAIVACGEFVYSERWGFESFQFPSFKEVQEYNISPIDGEKYEGCEFYISETIACDGTEYGYYGEEARRHVKTNSLKSNREGA